MSGSARPRGANTSPARPSAAKSRPAALDQRDRFVALAFCAADLLFELDSEERIVFAGGATKLLIGRDQDELIGQEFLGLIAAADQAVVQRVLERARSGQRFDHVVVHFIDGAEVKVPLLLRGYHLPDLDGRVFIAGRIPDLVAAPTGRNHERDPVTGLIARDAFSEAAAAAAQQAARAGEALQLTFLSFADLAQLKERVSLRAQQDLTASLSAALRASSVGGDTAGRLDEDRYGLIHTLQTDLAALKAEIATLTAAADPTHRGIAVTTATVALDTQAAEPARMARVLRYAVERYCDQAAGAFNMTTLSEGLSALTAETVGRMEQLRQAIDEAGFSVVYQPICDLMTLRPHHFEALVRFDRVWQGAGTYEAITFAEEVGLICALDLAMCRRVLEELPRFNKLGHRYNIAVNLSAQSLATPTFLRDLTALLARHTLYRDHLMFEVTESAKVSDLTQLNGAIQRLRKDGHIVCLDDLGAGEAAFRYLGQLDVDVAKIDGQFVRESIVSAKGKALLRAMVSACRDLGVMTIGEMIEDQAHAQIARQCGMQYGQGYLFGRPSQSLDGFEAPRPVTFKRETR